MPICRVKDFSGLVARAIMRSRQKPHYWHIFLWRDKKSFIANTKQTDEHTVACHCCASILVDPESGEILPSKKLGEVHFLAGKWNMEIVSHELQHAIVHRMRCLCPSFNKIDLDINAEEEICYEFGEWLSNTYRWLWEQDKPSSWVYVPGWSLP